MATATKKLKIKKQDDILEATEQPDQPGVLLQFFIGELRDIFWAENHLTSVLPKMQKAATSKKLAASIGDHLKQTQTHVSRLNDVFSLLGKKPKAKKCDAMEGITKEGESILEDTDNGTATRDVGIILASKKVEHYEIATYSALIDLATTLGLEKVADLLNETLAEEISTDQKLSDLAKAEIIPAASKE